MAADLTVHPPLRLKNIALNRSAACVLDLTRIDEGGSAGMAQHVSTGTGHRLSRTEQQGQASMGRGGCIPTRRGPTPAPLQQQAGSPGVPGAPVIGSLQMAGVPWNLLAKHAFLRGPLCLTLLYRKAGNG